MKVMIKEGWVNQDTGKKTDPRMQFVLVQYLQDVLSTFAKKLILLLNVNDLETEFIHKLNRLFQENKGDNTVTFEIMELEKIKRIVETATEFVENEEESFVDENEEAVEASETKTVTEVEEIKVVTKLSMASRRLKVQISNELLFELEKMQINFKLN
jgi:DNA polymerase-3 subunit alpha